MTQLGKASGGWHGARLAGIALAITTSVGLAPAAVAGPKGDPGRPESTPNGGPGPQGNPGSARAQEVRAQKQPQRGRTGSRARPGRRAHGSPGASHGRKVGAPEGRKTRRRGGSKPTTSERTAPSKAKAGKTTICHSTRSDTNPYVEITVSDNALEAHARHHDGRDIIPAPSEGCPQASTAPAAAEAATAGRMRARSVARVVEDEVQGLTRVLAANRVSRPSDDGEAEGEGGLLGVQASSPAAERADGVAEEEDDGGSLPFTGLALIGILATALLALAGGAAARRASQRG